MTWIDIAGWHYAYGGFVLWEPPDAYSFGAGRFGLCLSSSQVGEELVCLLRKQLMSVERETSAQPTQTMGF